MAKTHTSSDLLGLFRNDRTGLWPLAKGSLSEIRKPCVRPNCRACREGRKHKAVIFSFHKNGKKRCMYVPKGMVSTLRKAIANGRKLEKLLVQSGEEMIREYRRQQREQKKR